MTARANATVYLKGDKPCICLYVEAESREFVVDSLRKVAHEIKKEVE